LSSMSQIASQSSFTTDWSFGKWPRFLVTLRSWKFSDSIALVPDMKVVGASRVRLAGWISDLVLR